jgi:hypothetical protein
MRRAPVTVIGALMLALAPAALLAQDPPAQQGQEQQQTQKMPPVSFGSEAGIIFNPIKPDQTAAFEAAMEKIREALAKSSDPVRKQQAAGWRVYKAQEGMGPNALYVFVMDPAVKGGDYQMFNILQEGLGDQEAREIWKTLAPAYAAGQSILNLTVLQNFGGGGM